MNARSRAVDGRAGAGSSRAQISKSCKRKPHQIGRRARELRAELAGFEERQRSERATQAAAWKRRYRELREPARGPDRAEMERLGVERARLLSDNIELDRRAGELIEADQRRRGDVRIAWRSRKRESRANLAALDEDAEATAHDGAGGAGAALADRTGAGAQAGRAEVSGRDQPQGAGHAGWRNWPPAKRRCWMKRRSTEAEQKYQEVKARIEALGPVNPQALEEFQEAQQRYDFLNAQRQDLLDSIRDTEKAIQRDRRANRARRFTEAFEAINGNFREMFQTLFGGGTGEMRLTDETNIAESGIDIVASPPGKRLQNVLLLSGGEKSLTAMALLMAIFHYTPSPFCILDEVDAPLDEPNIERLTRLLKRCRRETQFIVITHAKRTMEAAQSLYGVTMQEPGVSKLVSVRFRAANEEDESRSQGEFSRESELAARAV